MITMIGTVHLFMPVWDGIEIKDLPEFEAEFTTTINLN